MISQLITSSTFVICGECGSTIHAADPENQTEMNQESVWLRCRNNCCGQVACYTAADLMNRPHSRITDHTNGIFLES